MYSYMTAVYYVYYGTNEPRAHDLSFVVNSRIVILFVP